MSISQTLQISSSSAVRRQLEERLGITELQIGSLLAEHQHLASRDQSGTVIYIFNLREVAAGVSELRVNAAQDDITLYHKGEMGQLSFSSPCYVPPRFQHSAALLDLNWSLRAYLEVMFMRPPSTTMHVQGKQVMQQPVRSTILKGALQQSKARPIFARTPTSSDSHTYTYTIGLSETAREHKFAGFFLYWNNCLIQPFYYPIPNALPQPSDFGKIGVAQLPIKPVNNKQSFDPTSPGYTAVMASLRLAYDSIPDWDTSQSSSTKPPVASRADSHGNSESACYWAYCDRCHCWRRTQWQWTLDNFQCYMIDRDCSDPEDAVEGGERTIQERWGQVECHAIRDNLAPNALSLSLQTQNALHSLVQPQSSFDDLGPLAEQQETIRLGHWNGTLVILKGCENSHQVEREVAKLLCLRHPNIIQIYFYCLNPPLIGMERHGQTLNSFFDCYDGYETLSLSSIMDIAEQICRGVVYLHEQAVIHNDLHPANVLAVFDNTESSIRVKLIDFGLSFTLGRDNSTQSVLVGAEMRYASPEKLTAASAAWRPQPSSDVYSLTSLVMYVFTNLVPWAFVSSNQEINPLFIHEKMLEGGHPYTIHDAASRCYERFQQGTHWTEGIW